MAGELPGARRTVKLKAASDGCPYASGEGRLDGSVVIVEIMAKCDTKMVSTKRIVDTIADVGGQAARLRRSGAAAQFQGSRAARSEIR